MGAVEKHIHRSASAGINRRPGPAVVLRVEQQVRPGDRGAHHDDTEEAEDGADDGVEVEEAVAEEGVQEEVDLNEDRAEVDETRKQGETGPAIRQCMNSSVQPFRQSSIHSCVHVSTIRHSYLYLVIHHSTRPSVICSLETYMYKPPLTLCLSPPLCVSLSPPLSASLSPALCLSVSLCLYAALSPRSAPDRDRHNPMTNHTCTPETDTHRQGLIRGDTRRQADR
eukprot:GHVU01192634.1.p1 GENE.GHVU01192634.1~~GHVU01192634.1.p1  ORF type:complete len:225 (+),score=8.19 GHVU01192634.1:478-1152(+)